MIEKGADPLIADGHKKLASDIAKKAKYSEVAEFLQNEIRKLKNEGKIEQSQERINAVNDSSAQDKQKGNKKKDVAAPKQSYKVVLMNANG